MFDSGPGGCYAGPFAPSQRRFPHEPEGCLFTPGLHVLALQVQDAAAPPLEGPGEILALLAHAGPIAKIVLAVLIVFSIVSWAIILYKIWTYHRVRRQTSSFLDVFRKSSKFSEVQAICQTLGDSPLAGIFQAGYAE